LEEESVADTPAEGNCTDGRWRVELFGGLRVARGDVCVTHFRTQKSALLLAYLALFSDPASRRPHCHRRDDLAFLLWPESDAESARASLRYALTLARRVLEPEGTPRGSILIADRASVQLNAGRITTDVAEFEAALQAAARAGSSEEGARWLARGVDLYRGELLAGYFDAWALQERGWLAERYFQALDRLIAHLEEAGDFPRALEYARRGASLDATREELHCALMRLYTSMGQPAAARRQFLELERVMREELGTEPSHTAHSLLRAIEQGELAGPRSRPAPATASRGRLATNAGTAAGENRLVTVLIVDFLAGGAPGQALPPGRSAPPACPSSPGPAGPLHHLFGVTVDAVMKYEGRIESFPDEGVLALFGATRTHEDDAERAIRAALEIRDAARRLGLEVTARITTRLFVPGAAPLNPLQSLLGPGQPGQILVDETTYSLTRLAFAFSPHSAPAAAPGFAGQGGGQRSGYLVERPLPKPEKPRGIEGRLTPLIGREEELAWLQAALARALAGHGQVVSLTGEAGLGKSRLVAELQSVFGIRCSVFGGEQGAEHRIPNTEHRPLWLEGRALELNATAGYSLFIDLFRGFFAWGPEEPEGERAARLASCLEEFAARGDLAAERTDEMGPLLGNLLSLRFGNDWDLRLKNAQPEQIRHQTILAARDFLVALSRRQPAVLVLEDLHWADPLSLDLVSALMEALPQAALLLLCVARPEREHRSFRLGEVAARKCPDGFTELRLRELTPAQGRRLVDALLGSESIPGPAREHILETARGNPFFIEEIVRSLLLSGSLAGDPVAVPATVQGVIRSRVDRLGPDLKAVLQCGSVMGRLFRRQVVEHVLSGRETDSGDRSLDPALLALAEAALIYEERVVPEEEYSFQHVLTQETIYQSIPERQRQRLHQQVAESLEWIHRDELEGYYEPLAYHYERSRAGEKAVEYVLKAGEKARRTYLNEAAVGYFQRALERLDTASSSSLPCQLAAHRGLGQIYYGLGKNPEAVEQFQRAIAVGREMGLAPRELVRLYWWLGDVLWWQNRYAEMLALGVEGLALLGEDTESVEAVLMNATVAWASATEPQRRWEFTMRNTKLLPRLPYSEELRAPYMHLVMEYCGRKNVEEAERWLHALERLAQQHHDLAALHEVHLHGGSLLYSANGDLQRAIREFERSLELAEKSGYPSLDELSSRELGKAFLSLGDLQRAKEFTDRARHIAECAEAWNEGRLAGAFCQDGTVLLCHGSWERAAEALERAMQLCRNAGQSGGQGWAAWALGRVNLARGEREAALRQFREGLALAGRDARQLINALSGLEEAYQNHESFLAFCHRFREEHPEYGASPLLQWHLVPGEPRIFSSPLVQDEFATVPSSAWVWQDPFGDCCFAVRNGLEIRAANGRDLRHSNQSAPRLLRSISGEFAVQIVCLPASGEQPAIGGLLLWKDKENYLRLDEGTRGKHEISYMGCVENQDLIIGRGWLPGERVILRLERLGGCVRALCSADGQSWFTVGHTEFLVQDPVQVGVHAIGAIDRIVYPGAYPEGAAIRFSSFKICTERSN
jgi:DNA-binding SARP family transcriptional activator